MKTYSPIEERANTLSHLVGCLMGAVVCGIFLIKGYESNSSLAIISLWIYLFGVVSSYLASTLYHSCPPENTERKGLLRKFDHAAIYWHIAGSYSPITLIAMCSGGSYVWGWVIFAFVWICAIIGTSLSFRKMKTHSYLETACYVLMGLSILIAFKPFYDSAGMGVVIWVIAEGVSYITGAVLYSIRKVKFMHTIFHGFVILGDICHMIAVWKVLQ